MKEELMSLSFLFEKQPFTSYSLSHGLPLLIVSIIGLGSILAALFFLSSKQKMRLLIALSIIPALGVIFQMVMPVLEGDFNLKDDLPIHICRFAGLVSPIVIWKKNRFWLGILYFWIIIGTLNANITPDIEYGFPHWGYFTYWFIHSFLVILPLYYIIVLKVKINFRDFLNAFWVGNIFLLMTLGINFLLNSNYMYSRHKPPVASLLDLLGPWPTYLITGQLLAGALFFIAYLPFLFSKLPHGTNENLF